MHISSRPDDEEHKIEGGIFSRKGDEIEPWSLLGKQIIGLLCIIVWTIMWSLIIFGLLKRFKRLRVSEATEITGNDQVHTLQFT